MNGVPSYIPPTKWFNEKLVAGGAPVRLLGRSIDRDNPAPELKWTEKLETRAGQAEERDRTRAADQESAAPSPITHCFRATDGSSVTWCRGPLEIYHQFRRQWRKWCPGHPYPSMPRKVPYTELDDPLEVERAVGYVLSREAYRR